VEIEPVWYSRWVWLNQIELKMLRLYLPAFVVTEKKEAPSKFRQNSPYARAVSETEKLSWATLEHHRRNSALIPQSF
jgi:hypothetical protein